MKRVAFVNLGCKLNFSETSTLERMFVASGYAVVPHSKPADIYVVNTCSVTEHADKKCRNMIRRVHSINPDALIAVTGCYAQLKPDEVLSIDGVSVVLGAGYKGLTMDKALSLKLGDKVAFPCEINSVNTVFPAYSSGERTRSFLKVQDGCDYKCSYCTIPMARGHSRNQPISELVGEAREIASKGIREIVLTGVNTGDFGRTTGEGFLDLLKRLSEVDGIERYRISSIEPNLLTSEIVGWISGEPKFMPHFHIPLQSGCDRILKLMRRRYNTSMFRDKISLIRDEIPDVFIGMDVIVGFPGETDDDFAGTYDFLAETVHPAFIHVFPYSRRSGTPADEMPGQVKDIVKTHRVEALEGLCNGLHSEFVESFRGKKGHVLFES
ncbi:MAG: tRNA (N(6)-L-threonylcarbamoyladenosine(37)-C(2))-methylthiotransferase MtaB, partial [Bacteroidales bacterium]|nr:tRNA (N(6)-L-threonylcarbamoyladenosine(37)-C(2))-methylthiotransferase MtaB [Bacteroidales bacterium]